MVGHKLIEDQAAAWLARRDLGPWSDADAARLRTWLEAATANRVAYLRLEAAWEEARRLKALGAGLPVGAMPLHGDWRNRFSFQRKSDALSVCASPRSSRVLARRRPWIGFGTAASILIAVALGAYYYLAPRADSYSTHTGEVASVQLRDGSNITLNTASTVRVELTSEERRVHLERGEAFFVVTKDLNRPFVVSSGSKRLVAVGTQFSVWRESDDVRVVVTEGTVRLESIGHPLHFKGERNEHSAGSVPSESTRLPAGTIARATGGDVLVQEKTVPEAEEALSWRSGYLTFHETTLAEAVEQFNRYNERHIVIKDPRVAAIRISGTFRPTNYQAFVRLLREGYGIQSESAGAEITLTTQ